MPVKWMDVSALSFNSLLLLERVQLSWFPGWLPEDELAIAFTANPVVAWYFRNKCPQLNNAVHHFLVERGFEWSRFEEPVDGVKRKYWKTV